jgi:oligopeptide transport system ATP-binding protein
MATERCAKEVPELKLVGPEHYCACHFSAPNPIKDTSIEL